MGKGIWMRVTGSGKKEGSKQLAEWCLTELPWVSASVNFDNPPSGSASVHLIWRSLNFYFLAKYFKLR
jgi:hypothetical protein